jgi:hypothetical protein
MPVTMPAWRTETPAALRDVIAAASAAARRLRSGQA